MFHRIVQGAWCVLCGLAFCGIYIPAAGQVEKIRGVRDGMVLPPPVAPPEANSDWAVLQALITLTPPLSVGAPVSSATVPDYRGFYSWQEYSNRLLRDLGLEFYTRYPSDPRRWIWFEATLVRQPRYMQLANLLLAPLSAAAQPQADDEALARWREAYPAMRDACIADTAAPLQLRLKLRVQKVNMPEQRFTGAFMRNQPLDFVETIDWLSWGGDLEAFGRDYPEVQDEIILPLARAFFKRADTYSPASARMVRAQLAESPHSGLRELARAGFALDACRRTPMELAFTAVDGRAVDLAKLRGKVVLIDFWAATWCGACKEQKPLLKAVYANYHELGFEVIGIACENKESDRAFLLDYVKKHEMPWPQFFDGRGMKNEYTRRYGFMSIPQYLLLGTDGLLVTHSSSSGGLRNLEAVVRRLLDLPPLHPGDESRVLGARDEPTAN